MFTKQFVEYIKDNYPNQHIEHVDSCGKDYERQALVTNDYVEDKEEWYKLVDVLVHTRLKNFNYVQEVNLFEYGGVYQIEYLIRSTNSEWKQ